VTKDVAKEDSQPKYTKIAYQLLKTFAGHIQAAVNNTASSLVIQHLREYGSRSHLAIGEFLRVAFVQSTRLTRKADCSMHSFYTGL